MSDIRLGDTFWAVVHKETRELQGYSEGWHIGTNKKDVIRTWNSWWCDLAYMESKKNFEVIKVVMVERV